MDSKIKDKYQVVVGLEVHAQLLTNSKIFSSDYATFGDLPNTNLSVITLGHPGVLPRANREVVVMAIKMGLACDSHITRRNYFARKNYFYPDLPKGYQITQDKTPICRGGHISIKTSRGTEKKIGISHIHMEEDAGKSMHLAGEPETLVDYNRAGVALIEIVSEPDMRDPEEAYAYLVEVRKLVRYLGICDGNMEEGSFRCDANISIMPKGASEYGTKVEVKNMNSFRNVQRAIEHEIERQIALVEKGVKIESETRNFDATTGTTSGMRTKETLNDYRYFPEPDLAPLVISDEWLEEIQAAMPSLPHELLLKFTHDFGLSEYDAAVLTDQKSIAHYFMDLCSNVGNYKAAANWVIGPIKSYLNEHNLHITDFPLLPEQIAGLIRLIDENKVSHSVAAKQIYPFLLEHPDRPALQVAEEQGLLQQADRDTLQQLIQQVIERNPKKVAEYKSGKKNLLGMFMGDLMKLTEGKADPKAANQLLRESLEKA
jgi:aspartyl-tRNA(Asn)/glutamyl-tRNA(Gln) amidotransferase subunit B